MLVETIYVLPQSALRSLIQLQLGGSEIATVVGCYLAGGGLFIFLGTNTCGHSARSLQSQVLNPKSAVCKRVLFHAEHVASIGAPNNIDKAPFTDGVFVECGKKQMC